MYNALNSTISVEFKINQWIYLQVHKLFCFETGLISLRYFRLVGNMSGILAV